MGITASLSMGPSAVPVLTGSGSTTHPARATPAALNSVHPGKTCPAGFSCITLSVTWPQRSDVCNFGALFRLDHTAATSGTSPSWIMAAAMS